MQPNALIHELRTLRALEQAFVNNLVASEAAASCALDGETQVLEPPNALALRTLSSGEVEGIPVYDPRMPSLAR